MCKVVICVGFLWDIFQGFWGVFQSNLSSFAHCPCICVVFSGHSGFSNKHKLCLKKKMQFIQGQIGLQTTICQYLLGKAPIPPECPITNTAHSLPSGEIISSGYEFNGHTNSKFLAATLRSDDIYTNDTLTFSCVCLVFQSGLNKTSESVTITTDSNRKTSEDSTTCGK